MGCRDQRRNASPGCKSLGWACTNIATRCTEPGGSSGCNLAQFYVDLCLARRSDYFETLEECALVPGCLPMGIGDNCVIRKCIIDKNARIGSNVKIVNKDGVQESNREDDGYVIKACITIPLPLSTRSLRGLLSFAELCTAVTGQ